MVENLISGPILASLARIGPLFFPPRFHLYYMSDIVASYHHIQFQGIRMIQTRQNDGPDLGRLGPNSGRYFFYKTIS